ncbi:serine/threonine protein kinase [Bythopirellula polymerisocia]|uniref:non-specific serine/threonine protein kinase n=1 Tax=Bythopirellula polymerisocia TaxID=2528003 RepID=A0A5C6CB03_9BACT|nr:serine/threonine-protein kinase [Bythopirellula polymerisocia]TWU21262.1 Serine/threonine-protein kinase PrkC [Bythopirellula polymerisocia]
MKIEKLGPYRIERQIGKGGMGAVYEATYAGPGQAAGTRVAVKALSPQLAMAEGFRERFEAEIDSLKKLKHEGIVRLYGYGEEEGMLFYSMELVEGTSLEEEINSGRRFNWQETLSIGTQICRALKHAHDHGVVHRDIKPANLLLTKEGHIKIADFGIARLFGGTQLTTAGGVLGTADYMSPEQADGRPVTEKCDQYSLGGVLFALLAGRPPFRAKTMPEMLQMQRFAEPEPVQRYAPDTPDQLSRLIQQLLSKEPEERFPNVLVLGRHMEAMQKALSRPPQSETKLAELSESDNSELDPPTRQPNSTSAISTDATSDVARPEYLDMDGIDLSNSGDLFEAPTIAQPEPITPDAPAVKSDPAPVDPVVPARPTQTRFTTLDDEIRQRQHLEEDDSHLSLVARWAALILLLGTIVWLGWSLTRPPTADDLFDTITATIDREGDNDLRSISFELAEFVDRFPDDPRAAEVAGHLEQLEYQKFARQARSRNRFSGEDEMGPIEQLYLQAIEISAENPARGEQLLADLIALFDPTDETAEGANPSASEVSSLSEGHRQWLVLARQELVRLQELNREIAENQLPALQEQLRLAATIAARSPARAARMYRAFINLYDNEPWAADLVAEANQALAALSSKTDN